MELWDSARPLWAIIVSLGAVVPIVASRNNPNLRESWTIIASIAKFIIVLSMLPVVLDGKIIEYSLLVLLPGLDVKFRVDPLGLGFALTASFLWIITSFYSIGYMRSLQEHAQTRYYACFAVALSAALGIAFAANLFTLFIFYEVLTLCTYPLVAHKQTPEAIKGARQYLAYLLGTSIFFQLPAIVLTYRYTQTLEFSTGGILKGLPETVVVVLFVLFLAGIAKAAMMPLHSWLPAAMVAPTPVSALLHAVAVVKAGVFAVVRVVLEVFGIDLLTKLSLNTYLVYFAGFTIIAASVAALRQDNLKLRLAYSTVSQLSYVIIGVALLTPSAITASLLHIVAHAFGKITLFFTAGAIYVATHKTNVSELNGIGRRMPLTMSAFTVGALSMMGIPPLAGFVSKWYLSLGACEAHQLPVLIILGISTLLNGAYFLPIVYAAFLKASEPDEKTVLREAPTLMVVALMLTAVGIVVLFFWPLPALALAKTVAFQAGP